MVRAAGYTDPTYEELVKADAPVAYWRLGETSGTTAADAVGTYTGTYSNAPTLGAAGALTNDTNTAVRFDGTEDVRFGDVDPLLGASAFSVEAWVYCDAVGDKVIVGQNNATAMSFTMQTRTEHDLFFYVNGSIAARSTAAVPTGRWVHIVATYDNGNTANIAIYFDGVKQALQAGPSAWGTVQDSPADFRIASQEYVGYEFYFAGGIDEVALYKHVLTPEQIRRHYWRGKGYTGYALDVLTDDANVYWRLNETSGTAITDVKGTVVGEYLNAPTLGETGAFTASETGVRFSTATHRAQTTANVAAVSGNCSFELWAKFHTAAPMDGNDNANIFGLGALLGEGIFAPGLMMRTSGEVQMYDYDAANALTRYTTGKVPTAGQWHHLVGVRSGTSLHFYMDGAFIGSGTAGDQTTGRLIMGGEGHSTWGWADFTADEAAFYRYALTGADVLQHYLAGKAKFTDYEYVVLDDGPSHYYRMNELSGTAATDSAGNVTSTYMGAPALGVDGLRLTGVTFDGSDDRMTSVETVPGLFTAGKSWTSTMWAKSTSTASPPIMWSVSRTDIDGDYVILHMNDNGGTANVDYVRMAIHSGGAQGNVSFNTGGKHRDGKWHHWAFAYEGPTNTLTLYLDGVALGTLVRAMPATLNIATVAALSRTTNGFFYAATIDEVAYFPYRLPEARIKEHYDRGPYPDTYEGLVLSDGPASYWKLDETSGTKAKGTVNVDGTYTAGVTLAGATSPPTGLSAGAGLLIPSGVNAGVDITFPSAIAPQCFEFWVKLDADVTGSSLATYLMHAGAATTHADLIGLGDITSLYAGETLTFAAEGGSQYRRSATVTIPAGWHHIVVNYHADEPHYHVLVDGEIVTALSANTVSGWAAVTTYAIGRHRNGTATSAQSLGLRDVATYRWPLTRTQIREHYLKGMNITPVVSDTFDRADSTTSMGSTDTGEVWTPQMGTWGITGNKAYVVTAGSEPQETTVVETGLTNFDMEADWFTGSDANFDGVFVFHFVDASNYLIATIGATYQRFYKRDAGTFTQLVQTSGSSSVNTTYRMRVRYQDGVMTLYKNDVAVASHTLTADEVTKYGAATKHGLRLSSGGGIASRWDNFKVYAL